MCNLLPENDIMDEHQLIDNKDVHNFEMYVNSQRSFIDYQRKDDTVYLLHTEVPEQQSGEGIASELVGKTLEYLHKNQLKMVPSCSYVRTFLRRHPEWNHLLAED